MLGLVLTETGGMTAISSGITDIMTVVTSMLSAILGNPVFAALFSVGFIGIGIGLVKRFKRS